MSVELQILAAFALDQVLGDPRWLPHPVRLLGWFALQIESPLRRWIEPPRVAGIVAWVLVIGCAGGATWGILAVANLLHPWLGDVVGIVLLYTCFAGKDLARHSRRVYHALVANDLLGARQATAMLVGRDTAQLEEPELVRAAVESVAENMVDGVTAPLFFAALGGPVGAMIYKAINTLDSTFGYKNERYRQFGWASARLDDVANYLPARITAPLVACAALVLGFDAAGAWRSFRRDGRKHPSPNSGLAEAAVAGALGVQLGGLNFYEGKPSMRPHMGEATQPLTRRHILQANRLMLLTSLLAMGVFLLIRNLLAGM